MVEMAGRKWLVFGRAYVAVRVDPISSMFASPQAAPGFLSPVHKISYHKSQTSNISAKDFRLINCLYLMQICCFFYLSFANSRQLNQTLNTVQTPPPLHTYGFINKKETKKKCLTKANRAFLWRLRASMQTGYLLDMLTWK